MIVIAIVVVITQPRDLIVTTQTFFVTPRYLIITTQTFSTTVRDLILTTQNVLRKLVLATSFVLH